MRFWKYLLSFLFLILTGIVIAIFQLPDDNLHITACNVGQGDAILITFGSVQILTDGGPDKSVLTCLGKHMPFWDREIELVILTHPDADHATGITSILQNYQVDKILLNPINPGTQVYRLLEKEVGSGSIDVVNPVAGMHLGTSLIHLDVLSPSQLMLSKLEVKKEGDKLEKYDLSKNTNVYSIVYRLKYKNFSALFPGDIPPEISDSLAGGWSVGSVQYIKIPHHGSNNGITENLLKAVVPDSISSDKEFAVISLGKNPWGFPKQEILNMLSKYKIRVLRTDQMGDVEVVTDGEKYWIN